MPYFHATLRKNLASIQRHGLDPKFAIANQNWPGAPRGIYLAGAAEISILVMIDQYAQFGDPDSVPSRHLDEIAIIVVDDARLNANLLRPDPAINRPDVWLYDAKIDITAMPILRVDDIVRNSGTTTC